MLLSSEWQINTSIVEPLWGLGHLSELYLQPQPWPWSEPWPGTLASRTWTLGQEGKSMFHKFMESSVGKSTELVAATLWDIVLGLLVFYKSPESFSTCTLGLGVVGLHLL